MHYIVELSHYSIVDKLKGNSILLVHIFLAGVKQVE